MSKGKFITFEGLDGSGKSTQLEIAKKWLEDKGFATLKSREPGGTKIGNEIRKILLHPNHVELKPECELLLYLSDRIQNLHESILPAKADGKIVLCDRSHDSTVAYQGFGRGINLEVFDSIVKRYINPYSPDFTILLTISPEVVFKRLKKRKENFQTDRLDRESLSFFEKVSDGFKTIASSEKERIFCIDGEQDIENIHKEIITILRQKLQIK
tara:strand:- start:162 stop:800 length:639 start_codon:yes stop_codon:yes gene_type:complete